MHTKHHALAVRPGEVVEAHHTAPQPGTGAVQRKQLTLQLSGNSVTAPLPDSVRGSVSIETK